MKYTIRLRVERGEKQLKYDIPVQANELDVAFGTAFGIYRQKYAQAGDRCWAIAYKLNGGEWGEWAWRESGKLVLSQVLA